MKISKQVKKYWWIGLIPLTLIGLFIVFNPFGGNVYGFSHQYTDCTEGVCSTAMYDDTIAPDVNWYGTEVLLTVGEFGNYNKESPAPTEWIQANVNPQLAELNLLMAQQGVKTGNSCKAIIEDISCSNTCTDPPDCTNYRTTCVTVDNEATGILTATGDDSVHYKSTGDGLYVCYIPYKCVLDAVYPAVVGKRYNMDIVLNKNNDEPQPNPILAWIIMGSSVFIGLAIVGWIYIKRKR